MKHSFWKRFLALVMAIAIVLSTGVLDSAGWLLANNGEDTTQEPTGENTTPPSDQQGGSSTETLDLTTEPTVESTGATDPSEGGETEDETTESTPVKEVTLTVVIQSVYADESQEGAVLGTEYLTYAEGEESKTIAVVIPAVEGYTFAVSGADMTLNAEGKYEASLSRPAESGMLYITVTYSPIVPEGEEGTEPETPAEGEETTEPETPVEGEETVTGPVVNVTVVYAYIGGVKEETSASYTVTFGEEETEKTFSLAVPQDPGYTYMLDTELDYVPAGDNTFVFTFARPEADTSAEICVFYAADTSVGSQDVYEPEDDATPAVDTYKFVVDGADYAEVKVIEGQPVLLPEAPQKDGYKFMGWYNGETEYAQAASVTGATYTYTAKFEEAYYLFFADEQGRVKETHLLTNGSTFDTTNHKIVLDNKNLAITGWSATQLAPNTAGTAVGKVTIQGANIVLYPITVTAFSITFDTQGGSLIDSVFYYGNETTDSADVATTTRPGYTFGGWYTDADCTTAFTWGGKLTQSITLYAKWEASQNTQYTVIHWWENANDDYYSFHESEVKTGMTGGQTNATTKSYSGFTVVTEGDKAWSQETIAGDGSTIVNIYYDRVEYSITFYTIQCNNNNYYHNHSSSCWKVDSSKTITAKHGAQISSKWPLVNNSSRWAEERGGSSYQNNIDVMPIGGEDYYAPDDSSTYLREVEYYVSVLPGETAEVTKGGVGYKIHHVDRSYGSSNSSVGDEDRYPITGFTINNTHSSAEGFRPYADAQFFYDRNSYQIIFMQGGTEDSRVTKLYEQSLEGVGYTPEMPADMPEGSTFVGWFDNQFLEGDAYVFEGTMPAQNITLYAKWQEPTHEAEIHFDIILENGFTTITVPYGEKIEDHLPEGKDSVADLVQLSPGLTWDGQWLEIMSDGSFRAFFDINSEITRPVRIAPNITSTEKFTVTYNLNGGTGSVTDSKAYYYGAYADVAYASGVTKADSVFLGWQSEDGTVYQPGDKFQVSKNEKLTAVWGAVPKKVSVTHNSNYPAISGLTNTTYTTEAVTENNTTALATLNATGFTTPTGYRFGGWQNAAGKVFAEGASVLVTTSGDNTVYAVWIPLTYNVTYKYEGDVPTNADALPAGTEGVAYGSTFTAAGQPAAVEGYAFEGWKLNGSVVTSFTMPAGNVELVGTWTKLDFKVTYEYTGTVPAGAPAVPAQATVTMGEEYTVAADPEVDGYTFNGWTTSDATVTDGKFIMPAKDVTLIGSFSKRTDLGYIVKYVWGETELISTTKEVSKQTFGTTVTESAIDIAGYTLNDDASKSITITTGENVIVFHYNKDVTFTGETDTKTYNGKEQSITEIDVSGLKTDHTYTDLTYAAKGTNVGPYDGSFSGDVIIKDEKGNDVTKYYNVTETPGKLTITKASLNLVITGNSDTKTYNGKEQEVTGFTSEGLLTGHVITGLTHVAKGTNVGEYTGSFTGTVKVMDGETDVTQNYAITQNPGKLTITASSNWDLMLEGYVGVYDAQPHAVTVTPSVTEGTIIIYSIDGMAWTDTLPTITDVGKVRVEVRAENPNYNPLQEAVILEVTPAPLTIVTPDADKVYDGTALTKDGSITGFVNGETATFATTGTQTEVGFSPNTYTLTWDGTAKESNYTISEKLGTLTVTEYAEEIVVTTTGGTFTYDGLAHGATVEVSELPKGYTVHTAVSTSTATDVTTGEGVFATADQLVIVNAEGKDVTKQLKIKYVDGKIVINPRSVTLTSATDSKTYDGTPLTNDEITVGGDGFVEGEGANYNVTGTITDVGSVDNAFTYTLKDGTKADNYKITVNFGKLTIDKVTTEIVITADSNSKTYDGQPLTDDGYTYTQNVLAEGDELTAVVEGSQTDVGTADNVVTSYKVMRGETDVTANYTFGASVKGTLTVTKRSVTLTSATDSKTYDGKALTNATVTVTGDGFVNGEGATYAVTGSQTLVGSSDNTFTYTLKDGTAASNYDIETVFGKLTVTDRTEKYKITVEANSGEYKYDGNEKTASGFKTLEFEVEGNTYTVEGLSASNTQTDAGTYTVEITGTAVVKDAAGNDVTAQFTVTEVDGKLVINKREVTLTSADDTKTYDGTALTNSKVTVSGDGFVTGEGATYDVTGSQLTVGSSENAFTYTLTEGTNADNYEIKTVFGTLKVIDRDAKFEIIVVANSDEFTYDGTEKNVTGFETLTFTVGGQTYTVEGLTASETQTQAGTYTVEITGTAVVKDANGNNVTAQFIVHKENGSLVINKAALTITADNAFKVYDGTALTKDSYTNTTLAAGDEIASVTVTGSQTIVGTSANVPSAAVIKNAAGEDVTASYDITYANGTLEVTKKSITITADNATKTYDGTALVKNSYTNSALGAGDKIDSVTVTGSKTTVGTAPNVPTNAKIVNAAGEDVTKSYDITYVNGTLEVTKRKVTLTSATDSKEYDGKALTNDTVTVTGDGFAEGEGATYDVTGTITYVGDVKNEFTYTLNEGTLADNYTITVAFGTLEITPVTDKVTVTITERSAVFTYDSTTKYAEGYDVSIDNALYTEADFVFDGFWMTAGLDAGVYKIYIEAEEFENINKNFTNVEFVIVDGTLTINKMPLEITAGSAEKEYDGTALTENSYTATDLGERDRFDSVTVTGSITEVGTTDNVPSNAKILNGHDVDVTYNYDITYTNGTLEITQSTKELKVTANSNTWTYDSETHSDGGYTVTYGDESYTVEAGKSVTLSTGDTVTAAITKTVKNVDDSGVNEIVTLVVDNADQYAKITEVDGTLTITQKDVTITADSASREYNGAALTKDSYTSTDLAEGDSYKSVTVTGSITEVGKVDNVPSAAVIMDGEEDVTANYNITYVDGQLEITASSKSLVVTANSNTWEYDSEYHADGGYTVTYNGETYTVAAGESATLSTGDKVTATITAQVKNVADTAEGNNEIVTLVVENAEQYASIVEVDGTLTITQKDVTITAASDAKEYDGTALVNDGYTIEGLAGTDAETSVTVTGSITEIGKVDNVPSDAIIMDGEEDVTANYAITYVNGQLEITASTKVLTVTANSNTWTYDSETHSDGGYTVTYGNESYTVEAGESATLSTGDKVTATITKTVKNVADSGVNEIVTLVVENADQYASIVEVDGTLTVTQKAVTITADSASREYNGTALTKDSYTSTDLAEGDSYKSVTVTGTITEVGSVDNVPSAAIIMDGEEDVTANYDITYVNGKLTITALTDEIVVTITENSGEYLYDGDEKTVSGYEVTEISNPLYTVNDFTFSGDATVSGTDAGTYEMKLSPEDFTNTSKNFEKVTFVIVDGDLEINKRSVTMTSATDSKAYDGTALTNATITVTGDGFATGEGATYDVTGSQTEFGTSSNSFTYTLNEGTKADNYIIETVEGTLTVTASQKTVTVTITENSDTVMYDGAEHSVKGYEVTGISDPLYTVNDFSFSGNATVSGTDAGTYDMELTADMFKNISTNFSNVEFEIVDGTLEITKRTVTMTSATDSKVYDGTALTNDTVTVTGDGFAENEGASYDVTGTITEVGTVENAFTYTLDEGTKADNYIIKTVEGTLTVTAVTDKVTVVITENSDTVVYDGEEHSVKGYEVTSISNPLYTVDDFTFSGNAAVNAVDAGVYDMLLTSGNFTNKSPNFANVEFVIVDGQLTINKRNVTLTSASDSKEYDGIALTAKTVEITAGSFAPNEGYTVNITGSQTLVGKSDNTFSYALTQNTKSGNYEITVVYGELQVTDRTEPFAVVVEANSGEHVYDGQPFTVSGLKEATVARMAARIDGQIVTFLLNGETYTISGLHAERTETHVNPAAPTAVDVLPYSGYEVAITGTPVITDSEGNDVTKQFTVETISGLLTIHPAPVTMVSGDATKPYDGTELINHEVTATGFVEGEGAEYAVTGTQTLVGSSENAFTYTLNEGTQAQDYRIETTFGTLTVTAPEDYEIIDKTHTTETLYRLGDTVTFDITVKNIFSEEAKVVITEQEGVSILWNGQKVQSIETTIPAGETITLQAEYTLQEKDILAGEFTNVVDANIKATVDKIPYEGDDDDDDKVDEIEDPKAKLTLDKVTTSTPANGSKYVVGETITYQITATNSGNLTLHDVVIYDLLTGESQSKYAVETDPVEYTFELDVNLAPGESATVTYTHTVTEEDLGKNLINAVTGSAGNSSETDDEEKNDTPTEIIPDEVKDPTDDIRRDLDVEKNVLNYQDPYRLGSFIEYEIVVTNRGNVTERDVIVTDIVDSRGGAYYLSFTDLGGGLLLPGNRVQIPGIAPGETVTILCHYWIGADDEALPVNNKAVVESADGETGDEDDAETVMVEKLYTLTIYYLTDDWQTVLAPEYHDRYSVGYTYYVESPEIEGYEANYKAIWSGWDGMPEHDVVCYVLYSKLPEETTEPTTEPTDPSEETTEPTTAPTEPTYDLTEIPEEEVPLGDVDLGDHTCCIMHFLIMLVAMILLGFYTKDRKKYQERIHELKRSLAAEDAAAAAAGEEQA